MLKTIVSSKLDKQAILLCSIILLAATLRFSSLGLIEFKDDEGYHCINAWNIATGRELPIFGPRASILGTSLGPIYYYLLAIPCLISPLPESIAIFIGLVNLAALYLCYMLGTKLYNRMVGIIATALYATSPMAVIFSRRIWNPCLLPFFTILTFYSFIKLGEKGNRKYLWVLLVSLIIALQLHPSAFILIPVLLVLDRLYKPKIRIQNVLLGLMLTVIALSIFLFSRFGSAGDVEGLIGTVFKGGLVQVAAALGYFIQMIGTFDILGRFFLEGTFFPATYKPLNPILQNYLEVGLYLASISFISYIAYAGRRLNEVLLILWNTVPLALIFIVSNVIVTYFAVHFFIIAYPSQFLIIAILLNKLWERGISPRFHLNFPKPKFFRIVSAILVLLIIGGQLLQYANFYSHVSQMGGIGNGSTAEQKERAVNYIIESSGGKSFKVAYASNGISAYQFLLAIRGVQPSDSARVGYVIVDPYLNVTIPDPVQKLIDKSREMQQFGLAKVYTFAED